MESHLTLPCWLRVNISKNAIPFTTALWWIWRDRNHYLFDSSNPWSNNKILHLIRHCSADYVRFGSEVLSLNQQHNFNSWSSPPLHTVKVNCDGSLYVHDCKAGFGCVIRDSNGLWLRGCSASLIEESVLRYSLEAYLITQTSNMAMNQDTRDLQAKIIDILHWDWTARIQLIQRETNSVADSMAKEAAMVQYDYVEWIVPQPSLVSLIRMDSPVLP
ncbi:hypothetical protein PIB30_033476 [Stylosanthes scabra]|uniref:RNase H type-1 domain-containing protein n=1 Tax=Stylosanthes scabra TaxID=79078 RepID=A0ABU6XC67_9FABA|nr:hypothetical protein [Stylosanthes scabra]